jgi:hypothetical protein
VSRLTRGPNSRFSDWNSSPEVTFPSLERMGHEVESRLGIGLHTCAEQSESILHLRCGR